MDRLKTHFTVILLILGSHVIAQNKLNLQNFETVIADLKESIVIQTNANTFIVGETLYYNVTCLSTKNDHIGFSKIAYVELVDSKKNSLFKHKIFLVNGQSYSDFFIPSYLETGHYKLIGYTNLILNQKEKTINVLDIYIINPYQKINSEIKSDTLIKKNKLNNNDNTKDIECKLYKNEFGTREQVTMDVNFNSETVTNKTFSVSVKKIDSLSTFFPNSNTQENIIVGYNPIPEIRGEIITGKIIAKVNNSTLDNKIISLTIQGENNEYKVTKTDAMGKFVFNVENKNTSTTVLVQIIDQDRLNYGIEIIKDPNLDVSQISFTSLNLSKNLISSLEQRAFASQVKNAYYDQKKDSIQPITVNNLIFDPKLTIQYNLKDYTRFQTVKETIIEVTTILSLVKNGEEYNLIVNDFDNKNEFPYPSLVIFDGIIIQNIKNILDFNPNLIEKISVVPGGYMYGFQKYNGVVIFKSKNGDYQVKESGDFIQNPKILRPQIIKTYYNPDYTTNLDLKRIPDYRHQLLWNPSFNIQKNSNKIIFYTSDITGEFEIIIQGFDGNGKQIMSRKTITVK